METIKQTPLVKELSDYTIKYMNNTVNRNQTIEYYSLEK